MKENIKNERNRICVACGRSSRRRVSPLHDGESPVVLGALPVNVLVINIAGSFILGMFSILSTTWNLDSRYSLLVAIGFCGSLTTMSSFALETNNLLENRQLANMAINILANVELSIGVVMVGRMLISLIVKDLEY